MTTKSVKNRKPKASAPITFKEVHAEVSKVVPMTERTLYNDLKQLGIRPIGKRQRPQCYAADSAARVLVARGYREAA